MLSAYRLKELLFTHVLGRSVFLMPAHGCCDGGGVMHLVAGKENQERDETLGSERKGIIEENA